MSLFAWRLNYAVASGPDISEGGAAEERKYGEVVLVGRLRDALGESIRVFPMAIEEAIKKVLRTESQESVQIIRLFIGW